MINTVGEKREGEFVRGSSKPYVEETLNNKVRKLITEKCQFKYNGRVLEISQISEIQIESTVTGDFICDGKHYNLQFDGQARIHISEQGGESSCVMKVKGLATVSDGESLAISNVINLLKLHGE